MTVKPPSIVVGNGYKISGTLNEEGHRRTRDEEIPSVEGHAERMTGDPADKHGHLRPRTGKMNMNPLDPPPRKVAGDPKSLQDILEAEESEPLAEMGQSGPGSPNQRQEKGPQERDVKRTARDENQGSTQGLFRRHAHAAPTLRHRHDLEGDTLPPKLGNLSINEGLGIDGVIPKNHPDGRRSIRAH